MRTPQEYNQNEILEILDQALDHLVAHDIHLLEMDLSEQSIAHRLAIYLERLFPGYHVDCEYNGDVDNKRNRKRIESLLSDFKEINKLKAKELTLPEDEIIGRNCFPDIIVHIRGRNDFNLCIIELKKSTNQTVREFDFLKLHAYTTSGDGNHLRYQLGVFIDVPTGPNGGNFEKKFFSDGVEITL